jgi:hypothetical protein
MFKGMLKPIADLPAASITRGKAFEFLDSLRGAPVLAARLRMELGGAWDYALDAEQLRRATLLRLHDAGRCVGNDGNA